MNRHLAWLLVVASAYVALLGWSWLCLAAVVAEGRP